MTSSPQKPLARFDISSDDISRTVKYFYAAVRADKVLGPIFATLVTDWPEHEEKISAFWRNAILFERSYDGNPMKKHMSASNVMAEHFPIWLSLFERSLNQTLNAPTAQAWSALAHRIGRGFSMGIAERDRAPDRPPSLF